jgi:uncharacterized protein (DUF427 family)
MPAIADRKRSAFAEHPDYRVDFEPCAKRVRVLFGGETVADTTRVRLMRETGHVPVYYFPKADLRMDLLESSQHRTFCPFKGYSSYWHLAVGARKAENAAWSYAEPFDEVAGIKDYLAFYWDRMDAWYEEDEEVLVHARDPHVRIDLLESHRPLEVVVGGEVVAATRRALFLFETGLPVRYYIPPEDVRRDLLRPSETETACPYKGTASHVSLQAGDRHHVDIAWTYRRPLADVARVKDMICFYNERVDAIVLDGETLPKPNTKWS